MKISLIVTIYNRLPALQMLMKALCAQKNSGNFEVIIADDGSTEDITRWIAQEKTSLPFKLLHVWQLDHGFRAAKIRNQAAAKAQGDYLIFIDGDCIPRASFLFMHKNLAEIGHFISGNRVLLTASFTEQVLQKKLPIYNWKFSQWLSARIHGQSNRCLPFLPFPRQFTPIRHSTKWQGAKTCNLAMWRKDFIAINGFDERYQGWGYEDSDLVIRLMRSGIKRKSAPFSVPVLHLWHPENDRSFEKSNRTFLESILTSDSIIAISGVNQYWGPHEAP